MKKQLKAVISVLLALVLFASSIPVGAIDAFAAGKLSIDIDYGYYGTAFVTLTPGNPDNYVTYTTDGSMPDENSTKYEEEIIVYSKIVLRVAEYTPDGNRVKGLKTTVKAKLAPVTIEVTQLGDKAEVSMNCATAGAEIRYTTDGSKPTQDSELYSETLLLTEKTKIRARAYCEGLKTTTTYSKTVKIVPAEELEEKIQVQQKIDDIKDDEKNDVKDEKSDSKVEDNDDTSLQGAEFSDEKVTANEKISYLVTYMDNGKSYVSLTPAKSGYTMRYTTDGSVPTQKSPKYKSRVKFTEPGVLRVRQYNKTGDCVGTLKLNVKIKCADITFTCINIGSGTRTVEMNCETEGATIYYTADGTTPDIRYANIYTGPVILGDTAVINAIAAKDGYKNGNLATVQAMAIPLTIGDLDLSNPIFKDTATVINNYRIANGVSALELDDELTHAACVRAKEISIYKDHIRPDGRRYFTVLGDYGISVITATEFIASYQETPEALLKNIIQDANSQRMLLSKSDYEKMGVGYFDNGRAKYWVILFVKEI